MNQRSIEILVGVFVVIGMVCLGYLAIRLGNLEILGRRGYTVVADFASVAGLRTGDPVEIAGVRVGNVESISLAEDRGRLGLRIDNGIPVQEDAIASVRARGLIGDKFVLITPGASERVIPPGGRIRDTESPPDLPDLLGRFIGGDLVGNPASGAEKGAELNDPVTK